MKKCKSCQQEIDPKATKCPHCQADQRNWLSRHKVLAAILVIVVLIIVVAAASSTGKTQKVGSNNTSSNANSTSTQETTYKIGDQVKSGDFVFSVNSIRKSSGTDFIKPADGSTYFIPNVTIQNNGKDKTNISTLLQMYIKDSEGNKYTPTMVPDATGKVDGELLATEKVKGDVGFEIPIKATGLKFYFNPEWLSGGTILVDLGQ